MALAQTKTLQSGVVLTYHRIMSAAIDYERNMMVARFGSYISEDARRAGKSPVETPEIQININGAELPSDYRAWIYGLADAPMLEPGPVPPQVDGQPPMPPMPQMPANAVAAQFIGSTPA